MKLAICMLKTLGLMTVFPLYFTKDSNPVTFSKTGTDKSVSQLQLALRKCFGKSQQLG